jgi:predicted DNA-binding transcriptional regulator AlpA
MSASPITPSPPPAPRRCLNAAEVGRLYGFSPRQIYRLANAQAIPAGFTLGKRARRWDAIAIADHISAGCPPVSAKLADP